VEELGELSEAVLASDSLQRSDKLFADKDVSGELADIILAIFVLSKKLGVDFA
jgi:NTP pyrophosphatase (non-canonical NTP hydrolase)